MSYFSLIFLFMLLKIFNMRNTISAFPEELLKVLMVIAKAFKKKNQSDIY